MNYGKLIERRLPKEAKVLGAEIKEENNREILRVYYELNSKLWSTPIKLIGENINICNRRIEQRYR